MKYTDKKEKETFLIYKEIQMGLGAKSYMLKGFLIYQEMLKFFPIYEEPLVAPDSSEFPNIWGQFKKYVKSIVWDLDPDWIRIYGVTTTEGLKVDLKTKRGELGQLQKKLEFRTGSNNNYLWFIQPRA